MELIFASHNQNKVKEIQAILPDGYKLLSLTDINCHDEIVEDGNTLEANAIIKARYVHKHYNKDCFADDTGLEVEALNGEPGVYSARYAGEQKNSNDNMNLLLAKLEGKENRRAQFRTVICLIINGKEHLFEGIVKGQIIAEKRGEEGFGYDPIFIPEGYDTTFAEMPLSEKNKVSHRKRAFAKMTEFLAIMNN